MQDQIKVIQNLRYEKTNKKTILPLYNATIWLEDNLLCSEILSLSCKMPKSPFLVVTTICLAAYLCDNKNRSPEISLQPQN